MKKIFVCFVLAVLDMFCFAQNYKNDFEKVALDIKTSLIEGFKELESMEIDELLSKRYERFRKF